MNMKNANYFNIYYCFYINLILFLLELNNNNNLLLVINFNHTTKHLIIGTINALLQS